MKILFLDFDDVICTNHSYKEATRVLSEEPLPKGFLMPRPGYTPQELSLWFDKSCIALLNQLASYGLKVVIISTWRKHFELSDLQAMLAAAGCKLSVVGKCIDQLPHRMSDIDRRDKYVYEYCNKFGIEINDIAILDDDDSYGELTKRQVQTETRVFQHHIDDIKVLLGF